MSYKQVLRLFEEYGHEKIKRYYNKYKELPVVGYDGKTNFIFHMKNDTLKAVITRGQIKEQRKNGNKHLYNIDFVCPVCKENKAFAQIDYPGHKDTIVCEACDHMIYDVKVI